MTPSEASFGGIMLHAHARNAIAILSRALAVAAFAAMAASAAAQNATVPAPTLRPGPPRAVIELFTSQGCADCPAADALLKEYIENENVVGLTLPVDYWDYLGWADTLAVPRNAERQRLYAQRLGTGTVYTPQAIVNGAAEVLGSSRSEIERAISATETALASSRVPLHFWHYGGAIIIEAGSAPRDSEPKESTIWLAVVQKSVDVTVKGGENKGKTLTYYNVVRELTPVGLWNGRPATIRLARAAIMRENEDLIVLIQEPDSGPIIGAARLGD
jgi:hypothetical protein